MKLSGKRAPFLPGKPKDQKKGEELRGVRAAE
jgi:hypothetical protein